MDNEKEERDVSPAQQRQHLNTKNPTEEPSEALVAWLPDLIYSGGCFQRGLVLVSDQQGRIGGIIPHDQTPIRPIRLDGRAILPGLVNTHSHAFQRVIRGRTEYRSQNSAESFWTWREAMYSAALRLSPDDIYDASRMAFLEMALSGITGVGEFHYMHRSPAGDSYEDPNLMAKEVVRAARDVGLRIALLRVAYLRADFKASSSDRVARFIEADSKTYLRNADLLEAELKATDPEGAWMGIAPHSVRTVPLDCLRETIGYANEKSLPVHMHVSEQTAEVSACIEEYGRSPVALLHTEGLLSERFAAVHAIHVTPKAVRMIAESNARVCACPTTERNLGDGVFPAELYFSAGVPVSLGTDSHIQIDLLEDARELEYNIRLSKLQRAALSKEDDSISSLAARLFDCASVEGARSLGYGGGVLEAGAPADFFTVDLQDPSIAGCSEVDLLPSIIFSLARSAIREVFVGGKPIVSEGQHRSQEEIVENFAGLQKRLWDQL